jgi:protein-tyrosine phosphatase
VDDGPEDVEESVKVVTELVSAGTETIVATPHNMPGIFETGVDRIRHAARALQDALATAQVPVSLLLGQEITFQPELLPKLESGDLLTLNDTSYFLFEFSPYGIPPGAREFIFQARLKGYTPVLAHPERNERFQQDINLLSQFVEGGVLVQLTAGSITGRLGDRAQHASRLMLQHGLAHFIASDCHSFRFGPDDMRRSVQAASVIVGGDAAESLVESNPRSVIEGRPLVF